MRSSYIFVCFLVSFFSVELVVVFADSRYRLQSSNYGYGPIEITNQYLLNAPHNTWTPRSPEVVSAGNFAFKASAAWTSTNAIEDGSYLVDGENREGLFSVRYGLAQKSEVALELPLLWRGGGVLDNVIDSWHDLFGLPEGRRERRPRDSYAVSGINDAGSPFALSDDGISLGNIRGRYSYEITKGSDTTPAVTLEIGTSLPTGKTQFGHRGLDFSAGVIASKRYGDVLLYGGAAIFYYTDTSISNIEYAPFHNEDFLALEWQLFEKLAAQVALIYSTETVQNLAGHDDYSLYLDTGLTYQLSDSLLLDATIRENPGAGDASADVTFLMALRYQLQDTNSKPNP